MKKLLIGLAIAVPVGAIGYFAYRSMKKKEASPTLAKSSSQAPNGNELGLATAITSGVTKIFGDITTLVQASKQTTASGKTEVKTSSGGDTKEEPASVEWFDPDASPL